MIIDAHTHLFSSNADDEAMKLLASMDRAGIAKSVLFPSPRDWKTTETMIRIAQKHSDRLAAVGSVSPLQCDRAMMDSFRRWVREGSIRGLKLFPGYEPFYPALAENKADNAIRIRHYIDMAAEHDLPVIFHTGDTYSKHPDARLRFAHPLWIDDLAVKYPKLTIVIAHLGYPWLMDAAAVVYRHPNVYADISGWVYGAIKGRARAHLRSELMRAIGYLGSAEKLLFGTDAPIANQMSYVRFVRDFPLSRKERTLVFSGNARRIYKID